MKSVLAWIVGLAIVSGGAQAVAQSSGASASASPRGEAPASRAEDAPARRYAQRSVSLLGGGTIQLSLPNEELGVAGVPGSHSTWTIGGGLDFTARFVVWRGLTIQPRLDVQVSSVTTTETVMFSGQPITSVVGQTRVQLAPGVHVGYALALSSHVAITPMVGYQFDGIIDAGGPSGTAAQHLLSAELPLEIFIGRNAFVEPLLLAGVAFDPGGSTVGFFGVGYRIGARF